MSKVSKALLPLGAIALFLLPSAASAQVIYAPVQYQYKIQYPGGHELTFYYGGNNPLVFERADQIACQNQWNTGTREGEYGVGLLHRGLIGRPPYLVFSDCAPLQNAAVYGMTPADARNEAYARAPRYFTKAALLAAATPVVEPEHYTKWTHAQRRRQPPGHRPRGDHPRRRAQAPADHPQEPPRTAQDPRQARQRGPAVRRRGAVSGPGNAEC